MRQTNSDEVLRDFKTTRVSSQDWLQIQMMRKGHNRVEVQHQQSSEAYAGELPRDTEGNLVSAGKVGNGENRAKKRKLLTPPT